MAELLLDFGADINWIVDKKHGWTLLMQMCGIRKFASDIEKSINVECIKLFFLFFRRKKVFN